MNSKFFKLTTACLLCVPSLAKANWGPRCFEVKGTVLYFAPSFDETYFILKGAGDDGTGNSVPNGKRVNNPLGYQPGFRLEGSYGFDQTCIDFRVRWTHIYARAKETVSCRDPELWATELLPGQRNLAEPFAGSALSHIAVMYQRLETLFDERLWNLSCWHFGFREGLEWSYIRYHECVRYMSAAESQSIQFHGHTKGLGPQIGAFVEYTPWCCFSINFMTTASLIAANSKSKIRSDNVYGMNNNITQTSFWRLVPEWHLHFGFEYHPCICNFQALFELGYEMTLYMRGTSKLVFDEASSLSHSFNQYSDFYVHGLFFTAGVRF